MYYVTDYYTGETVDVFERVEQAIELSKNVPDSQVSDGNGNYYYWNVELPF